MKVRASIWQITWRYLIFAAVIVAVLVASFFVTIFMTTNDEGKLVFVTNWGFTQYFFVILIPMILITFYFLSAFTYYYVIEDKYFSMNRLGKEIVFDYKNIEFIDIETSKRKHQVIFYAPTCKTRYLIGDKDGKLLETLIKKCPNILTVEEFRRKHPEERY